VKAEREIKKGGWEAFADQEEKEKKKGQGKKKVYVCFQKHGDFPC